MAPQQRRRQRGLLAWCYFRTVLAVYVFTALTAQVLVWNELNWRPGSSSTAVDVHHPEQESVRLDSVPTTAKLLVVPSQRRSNHNESPPSIHARGGKRAPPKENSQRSEASHDGTTTALASNSTDVEALPEWIQSYLRWHKQVRQEFPGDKLFQDPRAPPLLIRTCMGLCGGLNDRLGQLPWDLYVANQTKRVLLLHWFRPVPIRHFLVPNVVDWTADTSGVPGFGPPSNGAQTYKDAEMNVARSYPDLFEGYPSYSPDIHFWDHQLDEALERATIGEFRRHKVLRFQLLGHIAEDQLEVRLLKLGEADTLHWTPSFGAIFRAFFRPSDGLQKELNGVYRKIGLSPGPYSAVHCRVRHPKAHPPKAVVLGKDAKSTADKSGLPWEGETRSFAIATATQALRCAETLLRRPDEPVVLLSDSSDLARYMSMELSGRDNSTSGTGEEGRAVAANAREVVRRHRVVSTPTSTSRSDVVHIDKNKGLSPRAYYATFVDFYVAVQARCVTYGVGFYALFAAKVSGTTCRLLYRQEAWGMTVNKTIRTQVCSIKANESSFVSH